jgi:hypothetical protein
MEEISPDQFDGEPEDFRPYWIDQRRPFYYDEGKRHIVVGPRGSYHQQLPGFDHYENDHVQGGIFDDQALKDYETQQMLPSHIRAFGELPDEAYAILEGQYGVPREEHAMDPFKFGAIAA